MNYGDTIMQVLLAAKLIKALTKYIVEIFDSYNSQTSYLFMQSMFFMKIDLHVFN